MGLQVFMGASPKAKVLNGFFFLFQLLSWIATCVSFGGALATASLEMPGGGATVKLYHNRVGTDDGTVGYGDEACIFAFCSKCESGGKGLIAMQVFAFICLLASMFLTGVRVLGISISRLEPTRKVLFFELVLTGVNTLWFFLSVVVWGATCFSAVNSEKHWSVTGTGYGYVICCFLFLVFSCVIIYLIRTDSNTHLGSSGGDYTTDSGDNTTNYNPPTAYQYNADPAAAYAGSYNSDVMPPAGSDTNL